jgi:hypothetical protein
VIEQQFSFLVAGFFSLASASDPAIKSFGKPTARSLIELCGAVESSFYAASLAFSYQLLTAVSATQMDLAMGSSAWLETGEMMASPVRSARL